MANIEKRNGIKLIEAMSFPEAVDVSTTSPDDYQGRFWPNIATSNHFDALHHESAVDEGRSADDAVGMHRPQQRSSMSLSGIQHPSIQPHDRALLQSSLLRQSRLPPTPAPQQWTLLRHHMSLDYLIGTEVFNERRTIKYASSSGICQWIWKSSDWFNQCFFSHKTNFTDWWCWQSEWSFGLFLQNFVWYKILDSFQTL